MDPIEESQMNVFGRQKFSFDQMSFSSGTSLPVNEQLEVLLNRCNECIARSNGLDKFSASSELSNSLQELSSALGSLIIKSSVVTQSVTNLPVIYEIRRQLRVLKDRVETRLVSDDSPLATSVGFSQQVDGDVIVRRAVLNPVKNQH